MTDGERGAPIERLAVWDPWVRLVHWALVVLLPFSWWAAENGLFRLHFLSGYTILTLVVFRIAWGFVGSETARFGSFLRGPAAALRHFAHLRDRAAPPEVGHNAAGGWVVILLLALLLAQTTSGLFADDLIFNRGPLARAVNEGWSSLASSVHLTVFWAIVGGAALHILAVIAYRVLFGRNLVRAMITGRLAVRATPRMRPPRMAGKLRGLVLLALSAALVFVIASRAPLPAF
ncbi:MAG TPA: cytochrome b/b6 domain-containing protein [Falsiroseomonas sp.]|nr:cytochrome b/b6 domain-containing protein [Falsiroseomonas sp.]